MTSLRTARGKGSGGARTGISRCAFFWQQGDLFILTQTPGDQAGPVTRRKQRPTRAKRTKGLAPQGGWSLFCLCFRWCCRKRAHKARLRLGLTFWMQKNPKQPPLCFVLSLTLVHNLNQSYVILFLGHLAPENEISFYFQLGLR